MVGISTPPISCNLSVTSEHRRRPTPSAVVTQRIHQGGCLDASAGFRVRDGAQAEVRSPIVVKNWIRPNPRALTHATPAALDLTLIRK